MPSDDTDESMSFISSQLVSVTATLIYSKDFGTAVKILSEVGLSNSLEIITILSYASELTGKGAVLVTCG